MQPNPNFSPNWFHWSHHGDRIAFDGYNPNVPLVVAQPVVYTISILGPNQFGAPVSVCGGICPSWSPDDSKIEYYYTQQVQHVYSYDFTTNTSVQLAASGGWGDWRSF